LLIAALLTLVVVGVSSSPAVARPTSPHMILPMKSVHLAPPAPGLGKTGPLPEPAEQSVSVSSAISSAMPPRKAGPVDPIRLRVLVIAANGQEADLPAIKQALDFLGTPYTVYIASQTPNGLTPGYLSSGPEAFFQAVILTSGDLVYWDGTQYKGALTTAEWTNLANFESAFGIRQVSWYTFPTSDYGFNAPNWSGDTTPPAPPATANFTSPAGTGVFSYVNAALPLTITYAWVYKATPIVDPSNVPILQDGSGNALGLIKTYPNGRANLALTFDSNANLLHNLQLAYGVVNWATKGLFLGERHVYLATQPDDIFIDNKTWPASTPCNTSVDDPSLPSFRLSGPDITKLIEWQTARRSDPQTQSFAFELPFNAYGATGVYNPDTLTPTLIANQGYFYWVSHTWDHEDMTAMTYDAAMAEISQNNAYAAANFTNYSAGSLITPNMSGLNNAQVMMALVASGVNYILSDTSVSGGDNPSPNAGRFSALQPSVFIIPRHPTNLFFNVFQPVDWVAEYNCHYRSYWGRDLSYTEILDKESDIMLRYLLKGDIDPLMFHQPNLRAYDGTHSLLGDLIDATITKYKRYFNLPAVTLPQGQIGDRMVNRTVYNTAGCSASIIPNTSITITCNDAAVYVPVTGLNTVDAETYGGQKISFVLVQPGAPVTLPLT
jgi:hypothetical protein